MNEINLRDLFSRVHNGDQEAFGHVYQQLSQPVYTICWRITQSKETPVQPVMSKIQRRRCL